MDKKVERVSCDTIRVYFSETAYEEYTFKEWSKYGHQRFYVNDSRKQIGYIENGAFVGKKTSNIADLAIAEFIKK